MLVAMTWELAALTVVLAGLYLWIDSLRADQACGRVRTG